MMATNERARCAALERHVMQPDKSRYGIFQMMLAMCLSGTIGLFVMESGQPPVNVVFFRCLIGALCLLAYCLQAGLFSKAEFSPKNVALLGVVGLSIVFNWLALFNSYRYASIGIATTVYHVQPFFVFFFGALLFKEKLSRYRLLWLIVAFSGVLLIVNPNFAHAGNPVAYLQGCGLALTAAVLYAVATLASKKIKGVPPHVIALTQLLIGAVILLPYARLQSLPTAAAQWGCLLVLGVVHSALMYILLYSAYQKLVTSRIAVISYLYPLVAILVDYLYFGRSLSSTQIAGGLLVLSAGLCGTLDINPQWLLLPRPGFPWARGDKRS
jgi:drug/metabolite transporter (DMT)-like permease